MRFYTFVHFMLRPIQLGIQSEHLAHEIFNKYIDEKNTVSVFKPGYKTLFDWSRNHKTAIVLNGGVSRQLEELYLFLHREASAIEAEAHVELPWVTFCEDEFTLEGILTGVGVVLPAKIYGAINTNQMPAQLQIDINLAPGWFYDGGTDESSEFYPAGSSTARFLDIMKACPLAA